MAITINDAERAFYEEALAGVVTNPQRFSLNDLQYAYYLAVLDGTISGGGGGGIGPGDWADLNVVGVARAVFIPNGGTVPPGTPERTIVIELAA